MQFFTARNKVGARLYFSQASVILSTGGHALVVGGACVVAGGCAWLQGVCAWFGGVCGLRGACLVVGVCVWLQGACRAYRLWGACVVAGGVCGCGGCAWLQRACMVVGGMCGCGGHAWLWGVGDRGHAWDTTRYGQWAGGTYPTGMHSCEYCYQKQRGTSIFDHQCKTPNQKKNFTSIGIKDWIFGSIGF